MQRPSPHWTVVAGTVVSALVPAAMAAALVPAQSGTVNLATQATVTVSGATAGDSAGTAVGMAGDVNGDGLGDVVVGAPTANPGGRMGAGSSYVVFGPLPRTGLDLGALGTRGFRMDGVAVSDNSGYSVAGAGDVNGDGVGDLVVGAPTSVMGRGHAYVVLGGKATADVDLGALGARGFTITGASVPAEAGWTVAGVGDVNGDGIDDVAVGAVLEGMGDGAAYVVYGSRSPADVDLSTLGARGFRIGKSSPSMFDEVGWSLGRAGDVNGDGYADVVVGSPYYASGASTGFVVFGGPANAAVDLAALGTRGLAVTGASTLATSLSGVGDVNGDGLADVAFGAPAAAGGNGHTYVVYGSGASGALDVSTMSVARGFAIEGAAGDGIGSSVAAAGDFNGDGLSDLVTGGDQAQGGAGRAYVVYGSRSPSDVLLGSLTPSQGVRMDGDAAAGAMAGRAVSGGSDVTGDGRPDVLVGAPGIAASAGATYVVGGFGSPSVTYPAGVTGQVGTAIAPVTPRVARTGTAVFSVSPALPAGLTLDASTGTISGTPTAEATGPFTITMTDDAGTATTTEQVTITGTGGGSGATTTTLRVRWTTRGTSAVAVISRVSRASSYRLLARAGRAHRAGRCIVPVRTTAPVTCTVALTPGRWTLTAVAAAGTTAVGTARRRVVIRSAVIRVTG